ncbi:hypothetical protein ZWY2020_014558, partial [Hordeum vulgare]
WPTPSGGSLCRYFSYFPENSPLVPFKSCKLESKTRAKDSESMSKSEDPFDYIGSFASRSHSSSKRDLTQDDHFPRYHYYHCHANFTVSTRGSIPEDLYIILDAPWTLLPTWVPPLPKSPSKKMREKERRDNATTFPHFHFLHASSRFDELPDEFDPSGRLRGSFGDGDPQTTNLYVGNISPKEHKSQRHCGFVAFMNRAEGHAAKDEMQGVVVYDYEMKNRWGKSVSLPSQAMSPPPPGRMEIRNKEVDTFIPKFLRAPNSYDSRLRHVIDTMVMHVLEVECAFEQAIIERGRGKELFNFLWVPPTLPSSQSPDREIESIVATCRTRHIEVEHTLIESQRDEFEGMLLALTLERSHIRAAMGFALDNVDAAGEGIPALHIWHNQLISLFFLDGIVEVLAESFTPKETPIPTKVARLMLVSEILHNSSALVDIPDVMESFNDLYCSITGRITIETLKATFLRPGNFGVTSFHSLCGDALEIEKKTSSKDNYGFRLDEDDEIERKLASHRRHLESDHGLSSIDGANNTRSSGMDCHQLPKPHMEKYALTLSLEKKERVDDARDSSRKRPRSRSRSRNREYNFSKGRLHGNDAGRDRARQKSSGRGMDHHHDRSTRDQEKERRTGR